LGADIGRALGCGGYLKALRRIESAGFSISDAMTLTQLEARAGSPELRRYTVGMAAALKGMPKIMADSGLAQRIANGIPLTENDIAWAEPENHDKFFKIVASDGTLLAVIEQNLERKTYKYCCVFN
jgi:tRNA pseudouridine55 synthase